MINVLHSILTILFNSPNNTIKINEENIEEKEIDQDNNLENENNERNINEEENIKFYPYLHFSPMDEWNHFNRLNPSYLLSNLDSKHIKNWIEQYNYDFPLLTIQSGDFLSIYSPDSNLRITNFVLHQENSFDCIITSFFMDTSTDILDYLLTLRYLLKTGGIWINSGPLHYHTITSTPYSYHQLDIIINKLGFRKLESKIIESSYCGEENYFMKPEFYKFSVDVWKLESKDDSYDSDNNSNDIENSDENIEIENKRFILKIKR